MDNQTALSPLNGSVLVLNRFYMAVHVISVRRALILLYRQLAEVINVEQGRYNNFDFESWVEYSEFLQDESEDALEQGEWIRSVHFNLQVPRVVRLYKYDKVPKYSLRFNRRNLFARDSNTCQYCGKHHALSQLSFDHVVPRSRGGKTSWENVVCCCLKCNSKKGDRTPEKAGMSLVRVPAKPKHNPLLSVKLNNPKYECWRNFLNGASLAMDIS